MSVETFPSASSGDSGAFARPEHPLAVFLDGLQWLDAATLDKAVEMKVTSTRRTSKDGLR
jgi:hypothetical protein